MYVLFAVRLVKDPRTQRPKGFGFIKFASEVDAQNALKAMNGRVIGSFVKCSYAPFVDFIALHLVFNCIHALRM